MNARSVAAELSVDSLALDQSLLAARARLAKPKRAKPARPAKNPGKKRKKGRGDIYYSPDNQLEEAIESALDESVDTLVTRNHYGCLVLNAAHALFIDVDVYVPDEIYNPVEHRELRVQPLRQQVLSDLRTVLRSEANYGFRIYRTAAGFRVLATTHEFEPGAEPVEQLMQSVGADGDFVELCRRQRNFRARLSPKPWRCGLHRPPNFFPRKSARAEQRFQTWLAEYDHASDSRATCNFVEHVGPNFTHDRIRPVVEFHDRMTKATSGLSLA